MDTDNYEIPPDEETALMDTTPGDPNTPTQEEREETIKKLARRKHISLLDAERLYDPQE